MLERELRIKWQADIFVKDMLARHTEHKVPNFYLAEEITMIKSQRDRLLKLTEP
jgi:hypothetical protein